MTRRQKHMFGFYSQLVAGVASLVVGSADGNVEHTQTDTHTERRMCIDDSFELKREQCRIDEGETRKITPLEKKKQQQQKLEQILAADSMIVEREVLRAVIHVESRGNVEVGSRGSGCGVMQLTKPAIAGGLARLYSPTSRHEEFREKYAGAIDAKKKAIDQVTDNYFAVLEFGAQRGLERTVEIREEYRQLLAQKELFRGDVEIEREVKVRTKALQEEKEVLKDFAAAVKYGYLLFDSGAQQKYAATMRSLRDVQDAEKYISLATGMELRWVAYVGKQRQMIEDARQKACDVAHTELNVAFGDLLLATEGDYFMRGKKRQAHTPMQRTLFSYNQGRTDYLTKGAGKEKYYRRFVNAYQNLFDAAPPRMVPLKESRLIM